MPPKRKPSPRPSSSGPAEKKRKTAAPRLITLSPLIMCQMVNSRQVVLYLVTGLVVAALTARFYRPAAGWIDSRLWIEQDAGIRTLRRSDIRGVVHYVLDTHPHGGTPYPPRTLQWLTGDMQLDAEYADVATVYCVDHLLERAWRDAAVHRVMHANHDPAVRIIFITQAAYIALHARNETHRAAAETAYMAVKAARPEFFCVNC